MWKDEKIMFVKRKRRNYSMSWRTTVEFKNLMREKDEERKEIEGFYWTSSCKEGRRKDSLKDLEGRSLDILTVKDERSTSIRIQGL